MRGGTLDRRISIESRTDTRDDHGQPIPSWSRIGRVRWANVRPVSGFEGFRAEQFIARQQTEFLVRYSSDLADLSSLNRVVFPVTSTPTDNEIYDIKAVHEVGRREGIRIVTERRSEA